MAFMLGNHLVFVDSFQFTSSSLERLVDNLPSELFKNTKEKLQDDNNFKSMNKKGVYPYDYMDSFEKFNDTKLPTKESFYSILNATTPLV